MIIVRFRETFRARSSEWVPAAAMLVWGILTLYTDPDLFREKEWFQPLLTLFSQGLWGAMMTIVGLCRIIFLVINGAWRSSAHIRAIGCVFGAVLWGGLLLGNLGLTWLSPNCALFAGFLILDILSLWFSAGDAKLADLSAKGQLKTI